MKQQFEHEIKDLLSYSPIRGGFQPLKNLLNLEIAILNIGIFYLFKLVNIEILAILKMSDSFQIWNHQFDQI